MELVKNLIKNLIAPSSKRVGIYISSDSKLEAVYYDTESKEIYWSYKENFQYNQVLREVLLDDLEARIPGILKKMEVPAGCPVCICLPHILTSIKALPSDLDEAEIEFALVSEAEKSYIFKKAEPKPSWNFLSESNETLTNQYLYSVIQKKQIEKIEEIFERNELKLLSIDISFTALLRGLEAARILDENIENQLSWCIVIISTNNYLIAKFKGEKILNVIESPLALKSIEPDVLYSTLNATFTEKLQHEKLDNLYIVSQAQDFVASKLTEYMKLKCNIHTIDDNKFNNNPLFVRPVANADPIFPESIGAACWNYSKLGLNLNFHNTDNNEEIHGILGKIGVKTQLHFYLLLSFLASLMLLATMVLLLSGANNYFKDAVLKEKSEIKRLEKLNIKPIRKFNKNETFVSVYGKNLELLTSYDSIGSVIPERLWIDAFFVDNDLKTKIIGKAFNVEDIITYFENLQKVSKFNNLKIKSIDIISTTMSDQDVSGLNNSMNEYNNASNGYNEMDEPYARRRNFHDPQYDLPPPPDPEAATGKKQNYYQFVFENYGLKTQKSLLSNETLPDFVKDIILEN